jgi:hypothetical protein
MLQALVVMFMTARMGKGEGAKERERGVGREGTSFRRASGGRNVLTAMW